MWSEWRGEGEESVFSFRVLSYRWENDGACGIKRRILQTSIGGLFRGYWSTSMALSVRQASWSGRMREWAKCRDGIFILTGLLKKINDRNLFILDSRCEDRRDSMRNEERILFKCQHYCRRSSLTKQKRDDRWWFAESEGMHSEGFSFNHNMYIVILSWVDWHLLF